MATRPHSPRRALQAVLLPGLLLLTACPQLALFLPSNRGGENTLCGSNVDCQDGLECICGECQAAGTPATCEALGDAGAPLCGQTTPVCFAECGTLSTVGSARCDRGAGQWACTNGVLFDECPVGTCWGPSRPGEVCINGNWECQSGQAPSGECYTPGGCASDGGATVAPGCRYASSCSGSVSACSAIWCGEGTNSPAACVANRWTCEQGVMASSCLPACDGPVPDCFAACGDPRVLGTAACTEQGYACGSGVLRQDCPADTCWTPAPAGSVGCVDGGWVCGDAGAAPGGGCLTPNGCGDAGAPPTCYAETCCQSQALDALCVGYGWSCGNLTSSDECLARPICNFHPDAGTPDAAVPDGGRDAGFDAGIPDAAAPDAADAGMPDAAITDAGADAGPDAGDAGMDAGVVDSGVDGGAGDAGMPQCDVDLYEPNNARDEALESLPGVFGSLPDNGLFVCEGDEDWFLFELDAGDEIAVSLEYVGGGVRVQVYDPAGSVLTGATPRANDAGTGGTVAVPPVVAFDPGLHAVKVFSLPAAAAAEYALTVEVTP